MNTYDVRWQGLGGVQSVVEVSADKVVCKDGVLAFYNEEDAEADRHEAHTAFSPGSWISFKRTNQ